MMTITDRKPTTMRQPSHLLRLGDSVELRIPLGDLAIPAPPSHCSCHPYFLLNRWSHGGWSLQEDDGLRDRVALIADKQRSRSPQPQGHAMPSPTQLSIRVVAPLND